MTSVMLRKPRTGLRQLAGLSDTESPERTFQDSAQIDIEECVQFFKGAIQRPEGIMRKGATKVEHLCLTSPKTST